LGLLAYLATLGYGFYISFRKKDLIFFTFITLIAIVSLSENLLDVDKGIIFYAFFFSFFAFSGKRRQRTSIPIKKYHEPYSNTLVTRSKQKLELYDF
jgi:Ca2+/Na+ antiporter